MVDITRQCLQLGFDTIYHKLLAAYKQSNQTDFSTYSKLMIEILDDMNAILSTNENFLLGKWINSAKALATSNEVFVIKMSSIVLSCTVQIRCHLTNSFVHKNVQI